MAEDLKSKSISQGQWARFIFISGRTCIDFAQTGGASSIRANWESLNTPDDLADWFAESSLKIQDIHARQEDLDLARALREAICHAAQAIRKDEPPETRDLDLINRFAASPDLPRQVEAGSLNRTWKSPAAVSAGLSNIARDAVDLFSSEMRFRIRECANPNCSLLFVDTSRPGNRRWCLMKRCGNMAKTKRYRNRNK